MVEAGSALFDFSPYRGKSGDYVRLLGQFAGGHAFRSASVAELVLDGDFYRRPSRPEDLEFLKFTKPVAATTVSLLPSLASQRFLASFYELSAAAPPAGVTEDRRKAFDEFANEPNRQYAAQLLPFLEAYAFQYLGETAGVEATGASLAARLEQLYADEHQFWMRSLRRLEANHYLKQGLRFILIQRWCLAPSLRRASATALESEQGRDFGVLGDAVMQRIANGLGVSGAQHSYWQFYLPTSLSKCNLLYALARREQSSALLGAMYAAQAERLALEAAIAQCCPHLAGESGVAPQAAEACVGQLVRNFEVAIERAREGRQSSAVPEIEQGLVTATRLAERARWDLREQLEWLAAIDHYCELARVISRRIDAECPDIDRETFVEPRDMCSTTHVHNDHRLVTIETGVMHFWGNLGMRLEMHPGDRVLIPEGRLHGSTVLSAECTYHQPIIPDAWIRELIDHDRIHA